MDLALVAASALKRMIFWLVVARSKKLNPASLADTHFLRIAGLASTFMRAEAPFPTFSTTTTSVTYWEYSTAVLTGFCFGSFP
jgi:hypothetical protein